MLTTPASQMVSRFPDVLHVESEPMSSTVAASKMFMHSVLIGAASWLSSTCSGGSTCTQGVWRRQSLVAAAAAAVLQRPEQHS